jgi:lipopolysaccharide assembly protein A
MAPGLWKYNLNQVWKGVFMQIFFILALIILVAAVVLALQNLTVLTVTLFAATIHSRLGILMLAALAVGIVIGLLLLLPAVLRGKIASSKHNKALSAMQDERDIFQKKAEETAAALESARADYQQKSEASAKEIAELEENLASFSAALEEQHQQGTGESASTTEPAKQ